MSRTACKFERTTTIQRSSTQKKTKSLWRLLRPAHINCSLRKQRRELFPQISRKSKRSKCSDARARGVPPAKTFHLITPPIHIKKHPKYLPRPNLSHRRKNRKLPHESPFRPTRSKLKNTLRQRVTQILSAKPTFPL